ncbi:AAA family ATPase [bacterium]|nr:AAA family ATPase [bacterium]
MDIPPIRYLVDGLLPELGLGLFGGAPKVGKSFAMFELAICVAEGKKLFGYFDTHKRSVLYLSVEDHNRRIKERLHGYYEDLDSQPPANLYLSFEWPRIGTKDFDEKLESWIKSTPDPGLIIIDMLNQVRPALKGDHNYNKENDWASRLRHFAVDNEVVIILVNHTRKSDADDPFARIGGSNGVHGASDFIWLFDKDRSKSSAYLAVTGNDIQDETHSLVRADNGFWVYDGIEIKKYVSPQRDRIIEALRLSDKLISPSDLAKITKISDGSIRRILRKMVHNGDLKAYNYGEYGLNEWEDRFSLSIQDQTELEDAAEMVHKSDCDVFGYSPSDKTEATELEFADE